MLLKRLKKTGPCDLDYVDLDEIVLKQSGYDSLDKMMEALGEKNFRTLEREALWRLMEKKGQRIIALGGGTLSREIIRTFHRSREVLSIWLDTPLSDCLINIERDGKNIRPLLRAARREGGMKKVRELYTDRQLIYSEALVRIDFKRLGEEPRKIENYHYFINEVRRQLVEALKKSDNGL